MCHSPLLPPLTSTHLLFTAGVPLKANLSSIPCFCDITASYVHNVLIINMAFYFVCSLLRLTNGLWVTEGAFRCDSQRESKWTSFSFPWHKFKSVCFYFEIHLAFKGLKSVWVTGSVRSFTSTWTHTPNPHLPPAEWRIPGNVQETLFKQSCCKRLVIVKLADLTAALTSRLR